MKFTLKNLISVVLSISMLAGILSVSQTTVFSAETATGKKAEKTITISMKQGEKYGENNMSELRNALFHTEKNTLLTVKIKSKGKYYVSSNGSAIKLMSNTVLDLNASTLVRSGNMYNFIQNTDSNYETGKGKGYTMTENITIKNGTLDGSGGSKEDVNLVNLGHASDVTIQNVEFKNCRGGHLIEMAGCKDSLISNCTFTGYNGDVSGKENEAIQLDICNNNSAGNWNGVYYSDSTVCKNITIDGCTFKDYPSGVGNHHTIAGVHNSEIKITNNKFINSENTSQVAIWCYGFDNSTVSGNEISGKYSNGIMVSGGSVDVNNNTITDVNYNGIYVTKSNSYVKNKNKVKKEEYPKNCSVTNNKISTKGSNIAVCVYSNSKLNNFSDNTISASGESAVVVSGAGTKINNFNNNTIKSTSKYGVLIASNAIVDNIKGNNISGKNHSIQVSSNASVTNINFNKNITSAKESGVYITNASVKSVSGNIINKCGQSGILVSSSGKISKIQANTISSCKEYAIKINNSKITVAVGQNKYKDNKTGKTKINAKTTTPAELTNISSPVLKSVTNVDGGVKITWNVVLGASKYRVLCKDSKGKWVKIGDTTSTNYTHKKTTSGKSYEYTVRCITSNGKKYASSYDKKGIKIVYIATPKITKMENTAKGIKLTWGSVKGTDKYRVFRKNGSKWQNLNTTSSTNFTDTNVSSGSSYTYTIRCVNSKGKYCSSYVEKGWKYKFISVPKINKAKFVKNGVSLSWKSVKGAVKYRVLRKNSDGKWIKVGDTKSTSFIDKSAKKGKTYTYTVRCVSADGKTYTSAYDKKGKTITK